MFFPGGTQPSSKITEIPGGAGGVSHVPPGMEIPGVWGGLKRGGMDIFWNYTILSRNFPGGGSLCTSSPWSPDSGMKRPHCRSILESLLKGLLGGGDTAIDRI